MMFGIVVYGYINVKFLILKMNYYFNLYIYFLKWKYKGLVILVWDFYFFCL